MTGRNSIKTYQIKEITKDTPKDPVDVGRISENIRNVILIGSTVRSTLWI